MVGGALRLQPAPVLQSNTGSPLRIGRHGPAFTKESSLAAPRWCASASPVYPHAHDSASASASASTPAPARRCGGFVAKVKPAELWNPATEEEDPRRLAGPKRGSSWVGSRVRLRVARGGADVQPADSSRYYRQVHAKHRLEAVAAAGRARRRKLGSHGHASQLAEMIERSICSPISPRRRLTFPSAARVLPPEGKSDVTAAEGKLQQQCPSEPRPSGSPTPVVLPLVLQKAGPAAAAQPSVAAEPGARMGTNVTKAPAKDGWARRRVGAAAKTHPAPSSWQEQARLAVVAVATMVESEELVAAAVAAALAPREEGEVTGEGGETTNPVAEQLYVHLEAAYHAEEAHQAAEACCAAEALQAAEACCAAEAHYAAEACYAAEATPPGPCSGHGALHTAESSHQSYYRESSPTSPTNRGIGGSPGCQQHRGIVGIAASSASVAVAHVSVAQRHEAASDVPAAVATYLTVPTELVLTPQDRCAPFKLDAALGAALDAGDEDFEGAISAMELELEIESLQDRVRLNPSCFQSLNALGGSSQSGLYRRRIIENGQVTCGSKLCTTAQLWMAAARRAAELAPGPEEACACRASLSFAKQCFAREWASVRDNAGGNDSFVKWLDAHESLTGARGSLRPSA